MMYTPLDSLPELTPEYQQAKLQEVLDADVVYEYEVVKVPPFDALYFINIGVWSFYGLVNLCFIWWLVVYQDHWSVGLMVLIFSGGVLTYCYFAGNPDVKQTVTLTEKGLIVSDLKIVPDACFAALRYSGYVGIAISAIAVVLIGPMMLIGAGAGLLMSFKMAGVTNKPRQRVRPFHPEIEYAMIDNTCMKLRNGLIYRRVLPRIELENDLGPRDELFSQNKEFYFLIYASSEEQQHEMMHHLKKFIKVENGDY